MSIFQLREYIEQRIPAWFLLVPFVGFGALWVMAVIRDIVDGNEK